MFHFYSKITFLNTFWFMVDESFQAQSKILCVIFLFPCIFAFWGPTIIRVLKDKHNASEYLDGFLEYENIILVLQIIIFIAHVWSLQVNLVLEPAAAWRLYQLETLLSRGVSQEELSLWEYKKSLIELITDWDPVDSEVESDWESDDYNETGAGSV